MRKFRSALRDGTVTGPRPSIPEASSYIGLKYTPWWTHAGCDGAMTKTVDDKGIILSLQCTADPHCKRRGQAMVQLSRARFRTVMAGRQSGKTLTGIAEISQWAMSEPKQILWWVAPSYRVKDRAWRGLLDFIPSEFIVRKNETELRLELGNGSNIWVKSADAPDSLVSEGLHGVICDEAGQWRESAWTQGIRPMLTVTKGKAVFLGTPRGRNWFHRLWLLGERDPEYESFHWKTADSPYADPEELEEAQRNLPRDLYMQEYEADPHDNAQAVFRNHRQCIGPLAEPDGRSCIGVDLARKVDFTALVGLNSKRRVFHVERFQLDWAAQRQKIASRVMGFAPNIPFLEVDATGIGDQFVPDLRSAGLQVEPYIIGTNLAKTSLIDHLRISFEQNSITIPDDPQLLHELDVFEFQVKDDDGKTKSVERYQYGAPRGDHDDLVVALALANWGLRGIPIYASAPDRVTNYLNPRGRTRENYLNR